MLLAAGDRQTNEITASARSMQSSVSRRSSIPDRATRPSRDAWRCSFSGRCLEWRNNRRVERLDVRTRFFCSYIVTDILKSYKTSVPLGRGGMHRERNGKGCPVPNGLDGLERPDFPRGFETERENEIGSMITWRVNRYYLYVCLTDMIGLRYIYCPVSKKNAALRHSTTSP